MDVLQRVEFLGSSQGDAESWLGEHWRSLLDSGVDQVSLMAPAEPRGLATALAGQKQQLHDCSVWMSVPLGCLSRYLEKRWGTK